MDPPPVFGKEESELGAKQHKGQHLFQTMLAFSFGMQRVARAKESKGGLEWVEVREGCWLQV